MLQPPPHAPGPLLAFVARNIRVSVRIAEASSPEGSGTTAPRARDVNVAQIPTGRRGPSRVGGMGEVLVEMM